MEQKKWLGQIREKTQKLISLQSVDTKENTVGNMETVSVLFTMRKWSMMMVRRWKKRTMLSRSCQWKRPSISAQKNEFGERHEVLTTIGCEVKSEKPRARNLFRFLQSQPISNELYINIPPHEDGKTFNMNENYSIKFRIGIHRPTETILRDLHGMLKASIIFIDDTKVGF